MKPNGYWFAIDGDGIEYTKETAADAAAFLIEHNAVQDYINSTMRTVVGTLEWGGFSIARDQLDTVIAVLIEVRKAQGDTWHDE